MNIEFLAPAEEEFEESIDYYNRQSEGLGFEFAVEIKRTLERITQYPEVWALISKRTRRCRTKRFPYGIIYQIRQEYILIISIMHLSRNPKTWMERVKKY